MDDESSEQMSEGVARGESVIERLSKTYQELISEAK